MNVPKADRKSVEEVSAVYSRLKGNIRATAKELGISRSSVRRILTPTGMMKKPLAGGTILGTETEVRPLPKKGKIARYIITSAQNNTHVHEAALANLLAFANYYHAELIVGSFTYNQNHYGKLSVKRGKDKPEEKELYYDPAIEGYIRDNRIQLAPGLVYCGEYNALPTNVNPLAGLESYSGRASAIFPHAKLAMRSIATMQGEGVKLNYTTGAITQRNYIAKREGTIAEFHHIYGALLVEVDHEGTWFVRQLNQDEGTDSMQDLNVLVQSGEVVQTDATVEAITYGDLHGVMSDPDAVRLSLQQRDQLQPKQQFLHDVMEGAAVNPHRRKYKAFHEGFHTWLRGYHVLENELLDTAKIMSQFDAEGVETIIVDSNHDDAWIKRWLRDTNFWDAPNIEVALDLQSYLFKEVRNGVTVEESRARTANPKFIRDVNVLEYAIKKFGKLTNDFRFLKADESVLIAGKIEGGMHGHLGPAGKFGSPAEFSKMGRKANTAHTHSAGIYNGLYVAGTLSKLRWDYTKGPTNWTQSNIITYPNGKRTIITMYDGKWRAGTRKQK